MVRRFALALHGNPGGVRYSIILGRHDKRSENLTSVGGGGFCLHAADSSDDDGLPAGCGGGGDV